jgi:PIN domain nuclease of toxin-antitoxin system
VKILIDTHVFIWYIQNSERLPSSVATLINDSSNEILFSIASIWEMAIKQSTGKLNLGVPYVGFIEEQ